MQHLKKLVGKIVDVKYPGNEELNFQIRATHIDPEGNLCGQYEGPQPGIHTKQTIEIGKVSLSRNQDPLKFPPEKPSHIQ